MSDPTLRKPTARHARPWLALILTLSCALPAAADPLEIWLVRHAESEINVIRGPLPTPDEGVTYPLTAKGVDQAAALGPQFDGVPVRHIYSSTRLRTLQTADAISFQTGIPVRLAPEAVEISFGPAPDLYDDVPAVVEQWLRGDTAARNRGEGESLDDVHARFMPFWERLIEAHGSESGVIVLVTHGGIIGFALPELCEEVGQMAMAERHIGNAETVRTRLVDGELQCYDWHGKALR